MELDFVSKALKLKLLDLSYLLNWQGEEEIVLGSA